MGFKPLSQPIPVEQSNQETLPQKMGGFKPLAQPIPIQAQLEPQPDFEAMLRKTEENLFKPMIDLSGGGQGFQRDIDYAKQLVSREPVPEAAPQWAKNNPLAYTGAVRTKDLLSPTARMLAFTAGGVTGGPVGAGLTSGMERQAENMFDVYMGRKPSPSIKDNAINAAREFAMDTSLEGVSRYVSDLFKPHAPTAKALATEEEAKKIGVRMYPSEVRESKGLAQVEAGLGRLLGSSGVLKAQDKRNIMNIIKEADRINRSVGKETTPEDLGRTVYEKVERYLIDTAKKNTAQIDEIMNGRVVDGKKVSKGLRDVIGSKMSPVSLSETAAKGIQESNKAMYDKGQALYKKRNALIPEEGVPLNNTLNVAREWESVFKKTPPTEVNSMLRGRINEIINRSKEEIPLDKNVYENLWAKPQTKPVTPKADLNTLAGFKSNINADLAKINPATKYGVEGIKGATKPGTSMEVRAYAELANAMERDINAYSRSAGTGLTEANRAAVNYWREFRRATNDKDFARILKSKPETVLDQINTVSDVRAVKRVIGESKFNELIKPAFTNKIFGTGIEPLDAQKSLKAISRYADVMPEVYNKSEINLMRAALEKGNFLTQKMQGVDRKFLADLVETRDPKQVIEMVFTGGKSKVAERNMRWIYGIADKETKSKLKYYMAEKILFNGQKADPSSLLSDKNVYQTFSFNQLSKNITNNKSIIKRFFDDKTISRLERLATVGSYMPSMGKYAGTTIQETGQSVWFQSQVGAIIGLASRGNIPGAIAAAFGPGVAAAAYLHTPARNIISHGLPSSVTQGAKYMSLQGLNSDYRTKNE